MKNFKIAAVSTLVMIAFSGCVETAPTTSDFMRMHALDEKETSIDQKALAKEWDRGLKLKVSGEEMIKDGDHDMTVGKQNIEQGQKDIAEGTKIMDDSEHVFEEKYPNQKLDLNK